MKCLLNCLFAGYSKTARMNVSPSQSESVRKKTPAFVCGEVGQREKDIQREEQIKDHMSIKNKHEPEVCFRNSKNKQKLPDLGQQKSHR